MNKDEFLDRLFSTKSANSGGIIRRKISEVDKYVSRQNLVEEVEARGFHMIATWDQYVIFCCSKSCIFLI